MKLFTIEEANAMLPRVQRHVRRIQRAARMINLLRPQAELAAAEAATGGGGMTGGADYVHACMELAEHTRSLDQLGVQIKDYERGLIDFPCLRDERVVLLCWQIGEGDSIAWWHDMDAGFVGRQPL